MRIIIEMPEPRDSACPFCKEDHKPKEICRGPMLQPDYEEAAERAQAIEDSADIVEKSDEDN